MRQLILVGCFTLALVIVDGLQESGAKEAYSPAIAAELRKSETIDAGLKRYDASTKSCRKLGFDSLWYGKGRRLFDQKCKVCHTRSNNVGATFLHTESRPRKGWNRVFNTRFPKCAKSGAWKITADEQLLIHDYLYRYAANTYSPYVEK